MFFNPILAPFSILGGGDGVAVAPPLVFSARPLPCFLWPFYTDPCGDLLPAWESVGFRDRFPVSNMAVAALDAGKCARTIDLDPANTQADCYFGESVDPKAFVMLTNLSAAGTYQVTFAETQGELTSAPFYESAWLDALPATLTRRQRAGLNVSQVHILSDDDAALCTGSFWVRIKCNDPSNPAGYLEFYRAAATGLYQPQRGMSVGVQLRVADRSTSIVSDGGSESFNRLPKWREFDFVLNRMTEEEAFTKAWDIHWSLGLTDQMYFCFDRYDPLMAKRSAFVRMRALDGVEFPYGNATKTAWKLTEVR